MTKKNGNRFSKPVLIGLTGGAGVGKTEVAAVLAKNRVKVISADAIGHLLLRENNTVRRKTLKLFGKSVLIGQGNFNRKKMI